MGDAEDMDMDSGKGSCTWKKDGWAVAAEPEGALLMKAAAVTCAGSEFG